MTSLREAGRPAGRHGGPARRVRRPARGPDGRPARGPVRRRRLGRPPAHERPAGPPRAARREIERRPGARRRRPQRRPRRRRPGRRRRPADRPERRDRPPAAGRRSGRRRLRRSGCNAMARAVFRKVSADEERRLVHLDRDRPLVEAALRDPARFDALYRKYLAQVYSYAFYELGDHHDAEDATERTFLLALGALPRFEERARPADGEGASTFRVWLFQIARNVVANLRRSRRRRPEAPLEAAALVASPLDVESRADPPARGRRGLGRRRPAARRPAPGARPALRRGDVDRRDRGHPRPLRGSRPGADPPRPARRRARPGPAPVTFQPPETGEIDALVTDGYLDSLLAARERRALDSPSVAELDPDVRLAAARLAETAAAGPSLVPLRGAARRPAGRGRPADDASPRPSAREDAARRADPDDRAPGRPGRLGPRPGRPARSPRSGPARGRSPGSRGR